MEFISSDKLNPQSGDLFFTDTAMGEEIMLDVVESEKYGGEHLVTYRTIYPGTNKKNIYRTCTLENWQKFVGSLTHID